MSFEIEFTLPNNMTIKQSCGTQDEAKPSILFEVELVEDKTVEYVNKWIELSKEE